MHSFHSCCKYFWIQIINPARITPIPWNNIWKYPSFHTFYCINDVHFSGEKDNAFFEGRNKSIFFKEWWKITSFTGTSLKNLKWEKNTEVNVWKKRCFCHKHANHCGDQNTHFDESSALPDLQTFQINFSRWWGLWNIF